MIMEAATPKKRSVSTEGETMTVGRTKKSTDPCRRSWHGLLVLIMTAALISNSSLRADAASSEGTYIADEIMISSVINPEKRAAGEWYSDHYFDHDNVRNNVRLLKASALASASTYGDSTEKYLKDAGFGEVEQYYTGKGKESTLEDNDHCLIYTGVKRAPDHGRIIAVIISGYSAGGLEWISNFNLGHGETHEGFQLACAEVIQYLDQTYAPGTGDLLWVTGHSRGGALTNLVARHYIDKGACKVFAYGFAVPNVAYSDVCVETSRIVNISNNGDFVPCIPPGNECDDWNYGKNGVTVTFDINHLMADKFKNYTGQKRFAGYTVNKRNKLIDLFRKSCSYEKEGFFTPRHEKKKTSVSPQEYFQKGLALAMTKHILYEGDGVKNMLRYAESDKVYFDMTSIFVKDGGLHQKINDAHRMEIYLAYADAL